MKLEARIRETLRAEADRFRPKLITTRAPAAIRRNSAAIVGTVTAGALVVALMVWFYGTMPTAGPTETSAAPTPTTVAQPTTSLGAHVPPVLAPFIPEATVADGVTTLTVTFIDGSTAELTWPEGLDLMSEGVHPYGWAFIPDIAARDFVIQRGSVEDVVAQFGRPTVLEVYPDGLGGTVTWWEPEGAGINFLGFQFGQWATLVYDGGSSVDTPEMNTETRELWIRSFRGETTSDGFLRFYVDEPLRLGGGGPGISLTFEGSRGTVELVAMECEPGFVEDGIGADDYVDWCDAGGQIVVRVSGPPEFQQQVFDGLQIGPVTVAQSPVS